MKNVNPSPQNRGSSLAASTHEEKRVVEPKVQHYAGSPLENLPLELVHHVCSFFRSPIDVIRLGNTCRSMRQALGAEQSLLWYGLLHQKEMQEILKKYKTYSDTQLSSLVAFGSQLLDPYTGEWQYLSTQYYSASYPVQINRKTVFNMPDQENYVPSKDYRAIFLKNRRSSGANFRNNCSGCMKLVSIAFPELWFLTSQSKNGKPVKYCKECARDFLYRCPASLLAEVDSSDVSSAYIPSNLMYNLQRTVFAPVINGISNFRNSMADLYPGLSDNSEVEETMTNSLFRQFLVPNDGTFVICEKLDLENAIKKSFGYSLSDHVAFKEKRFSEFQYLYENLRRCIVEQYKKIGSEFSLVSKPLFKESALEDYLDMKWNIYCSYRGIVEPELEVDVTNGPQNTKRIRQTFSLPKADITSLKKDMEGGTISNYSLDWFISNQPYLVMDNSYRQELYRGGMKNIFYFLTGPPIDKTDDAEIINTWLSESAKGFVKYWLQDPIEAHEKALTSEKPEASTKSQVKIEPAQYFSHLNPRFGENHNIELSFVEKTIWEYAIPKFSIRQSRKAGLCRICKDEEYYTAFDYAIHLYLNHEEYFNQEGKWKWRKVNQKRSKKQITKKVVLEHQFKRRARKYDEATKSIVSGTKRYGPQCGFRTNYATGNRNLKMTILSWGYYYLE